MHSTDFYGKADDKTNLAAYKRFIRPHLDSESRAYWEKRKWNGRQRISIFWRDLYRHGLLGVFIGMGHRVARLYGIDPRDILKARTMEEQRSFFDTALAPLFEKRMVRWATARKSSLFGLGIPPQQYDALATAGNGDMALVLRSRLEKLACGFPLPTIISPGRRSGAAIAAMRRPGLSRPICRAPTSKRYGHALIA